MAKHWYYNSSSGATSYEQDFEAWPALHAGLDWHGPFDSKQAITDYYNRNKSKNPGWKAPTDSVGGQIANVTGATDVAKDASKQVFGGGLNDDSIRSWFIRIGEVLLGVVLVGIGVAKLTGTTNIVASAVKARI